MIKASELRIGNAIWDDTLNKIKWVTHRVISDLASNASPLPYSPIAITSDLLKKCGFGFTVSETTTYFIPVGDKLRIEFDENLVCGLALEMWDRRMRIPIIAEIEYLHQLQNLYHSHTGKELEIKL
jgi:hypothetical protein